MDRSYEWTGAPGDAKHLLNKVYGLSNANPIWVHDPKFGNDLFILQATPKSGERLNYVWNGIDQRVCRITQPETLGEIRQSIEKLGGPQGAFNGLELEELTPP